MFPAPPLPSSPPLEPLLAPAWRARLAALIFLGGLVLIILDRYVQELREIFFWALLPAFVLLDFPARAAWGDAGFRRRVRFTLWGVAASIALGGAAQVIAWPFAVVPAHEAWRCLLRYAAPLFWGVSLWLFSPVGLRWVDWLRARQTARTPDAAMILQAPLVLFGLWSFMTCMSSLDPEKSFYFFAQELGLYIPIVLLWARLAELDPGELGRVRRRAPALIAAGLAAGSLLALVYAGSGPQTREKLERIRQNDTMVIKIDHEADGRRVWRLSFPFGHHNRMAFFAMSAALVMALGAAQSRRALPIAAFAAGAGLGVINLMLTLNRGALVALAAGLCWILATAAGKRAVLLLLPLAALVFVLPPVQKERIASLFKSSSYTDPDSTIVTRFEHWHAAAIMIAEHPVAGVGYSWKNFENQYQKIAERMGWKVKENHAHNIWLQIGAESGVPAALLFALWNACRWALAYQLWRRRGELDSASRWRLVGWIALDLAIQIYCLGNNPLRRGLGVYTWSLWAAMSGDLIAMLGSGAPTAVKIEAPTDPAAV